MRGILAIGCWALALALAVPGANCAWGQTQTTTTTTTVTTTHSESASTTSEVPPAPEPEKVVKPYSSRGAGWAVLMYLPNRINDVFDIVRARLRLGPGAAIGARATTPFKFYVGSYSSVWAGLPGPRQEAKPIIPGGLESYNGVALSMAEGTFDGGMNPNYSPTEIGVTAHALIVGADVDVDPVEVFDLLAGFFFIDLRGDDL